jgi:hypothetical protein
MVIWAVSNATAHDSRFRNLEPTLVGPLFTGSLFLSTQFLATILNYTRLQLLAMMGFYPAPRAS